MDGLKKVLVTGASGGLGIPVVRRLLNDGWQVMAVSRHGNQAADEDLSPERTADRLYWINGDVTDGAAVEQLVTAAGSVEALVHLAGGFRGSRTIAECGEEDFDRMFALNTRSAFLLLRALLPAMKKAGHGSIVTVGAKPAVHPGAVNAVYAASKAALINLTLSAAEEGRAFGVRANVIVPAVIRTAANAGWASSPDEMKQWTPPEDIAAAISWLIAPGAFVTGSVLPMYQGMHP
jgi:NAD(P)-dependent dehydrogenase (short-subunit alcohol dehydrogenase family)